MSFEELRRVLTLEPESAVSNFFTPTSQKPKERTQWSERGPDDDTPATLLVGRHEPEKMEESDRHQRTKIAAFDLVWFNGAMLSP